MKLLKLFVLEMNFTGGTRRGYYLLKELARGFPIELYLMQRVPLTTEQKAELQTYTQTIHQIPRRDTTLRDQLAIARRALTRGLSYHAAMAEHSFAANPQLRALRPKPGDWVVAALSLWTAPILEAPGPRWVLDQWDADVHYWDVHTRQFSNPLLRLVARVNRNQTYRFCRRVYPRFGRILSVCEEDRQLTLQVSPTARVDVLMNGLDCAYFSPDWSIDPGRTILFTGTSDVRNMKALRFFVHQVYPRVRSAVPDVRFILGGAFSDETRQEFANVPGVEFTGRVPDIRPVYRQSAIFISPYEDASGTKMKVSEALAMGRCLVSLPAGIRGLPLRHEENVLLAQNAEEMAHQTIRALEDPALARRIGANGRVFAEQNLDWERVLGPRLREIVAAVGEVSPRVTGSEARLVYQSL
ncbi:MAG: glycosyltransferase family 4 protein [Chloroflexaceae bacterium]